MRPVARRYAKKRVTNLIKIQVYNLQQYLSEVISMYRAVIAGYALAFLLPMSSPCSAASSAKSVVQQGNVNYWIDHQDESAILPDKNLGNEVYYQVFLDRFANGNTRNDCQHGGLFCDPARQDWYRYWGGDLRGLIDKIGYLKGLGITRLWITPIFDNSDVTVERQKHGQSVQVTSYHGYWIRDWFRLNSYFTDQGDQDFGIVEDLVRSGMPEIGVVLDTVANHSSPADASRWSLDYNAQIEPLGRSTDGAPRSHRGVLFEDGRYMTSMDEDEAKSLLDHSYQRMFHRYGPIEDYDDLYQVEKFQLDGLSDFDQTNPFIYDYMRRAHSFWMHKVPGLAGYRMDTIKHIRQDYWRSFDQDFFSEFPDKEIVGEYYGAGPYNEQSHPFYKETRQSVFDFDFRSVIFDVFKNDASMTRLSDLWKQDERLIDGKQLITFIDNHDVARVRGMGMSYARMRQAIAIWFLSRGVPCVYYGMEQDLFHPGDPGDPYNRPMMTSFDPKHEFYVLIKKLADLRKANEALRYGDTHLLHESQHIIAFERVFGQQSAFILTSKNPITGSDRFTIENLSFADGSYRDVLTGKLYSIHSGRMDVAIGNGQIIILTGL